MSTQTDDFLNQALDSNGGNLTPEQAAQLLTMELGTPGDTGVTAPEPSSAPGAAPAAVEASGTTTQTTSTPTEAELNAQNAVIQAKDGKHTISYDKLVQARENARTAQAESQALAAQLEAANAKLAEIQTQAQARAEAGQAPTQADTNAATAQAAINAGVDPELFGDFSPEAMAKGVAKLVEAQVQARMAQIDQKLQPFEQKAAADVSSQHFNAIYSAHPDADSIVESQEFAVWKGAQPAVVRAALDQALEKGTTTDVIEVFSAFKAATGQASAPRNTPAASQPSLADAAKAAIANTATPIPASLSDIPGGRVATSNLLEAMESMNPLEQLNAAMNMTQEQREAWVNSNL